MLYHFLRFFVKLAHKYYFRTIYFLNEENIPDNQPIILAANHSNSALDALLISGFYKRDDLFWLARGDVFNSSYIAKFMYSVKTAPIYRSSEVGFVDIKRNNQSFEVCFKLLSENHMVGLFPEGITIHERKLQRPFKKGIARLAMQAHEKLGKPIMILPVGVSYQSLVQPRTDAYVYFGKPFATDMFYSEYHENQTKTLKDFTNHLENKLNEIVLNFDSIPNQQKLTHEIKKLDELYLNNKKIKFGLNRDQYIFKKYQKLIQNNVENESQIVDFTNQNKNSKIVKSQIDTFYYSLIYKIAKVIYFIPNEISKAIITSKIKIPAFWATVRFVILYLLFPLYIIILTALASIISNWLALLVFVTFPVFVFFGLRFKNIIDLQ